MSKIVTGLLILVLLLLVAGGAYVSMQTFPAPTQPVVQELAHETFIPAKQ